MNFSLKLSALFLFISSFAFSQRGKDGVGNITGTSIVNAYTTLSNDVTANTTNTISVANVSSFSAGDLVLIIQISGTWARFYAGDTVGPFFDGGSAVPTDTSYGRIIAYNGAGTNEMAQINSVNLGTNTITFDCQISKTFKASGKTQIVRVRRYSSLNISATGIITCPHWDRTLGYGGVVAIEVQGNTTIATGGRIDASGLGFRGGAFWFKNASVAGSTLWGTTRRNESGNKGESIAGDTNVYANEASKFGRGAIANGGGGGNAINAGGGGGANAGLTNRYYGGIGNIDTTTNTNYIQAWTLENTAYPGVLPLWRANTNSGGGRGGYTFSNSTSNPLTTGPNNSAWGSTTDLRRSVGGYGGRPLDYSNEQLYLGGGGGSGDGENYYQGAGGDGGGIVYFISNGTISGGGEIRSNGANGTNSITNITRPGDGTSVLGRDGAGGAGGGGAIYIKSIGTISSITINVNGGNGGNQEMRNNGFTSTRMAYGPGGGGGGGFVNIPTGNTITVNTSGGNNGIVDYISGSEGCLIDDNFPPNGATKGGPGTSLAATTSFSITTTGATICSGNTATISAALTGTIPNPISILWYTDSIGGSSFNTGSTYTTPVLTVTTIYWVGTCPGTYREKVTVTINAAPAAPVATTPINYCLNATASALIATATSGNTIVWYDAASSGNIIAQPITPSTSSVGTTSYYAAQSNGSCSGARTQVDVNILALPDTPNVTTPVNYCQNTVASAIPATPSGGGNSILYWGTASTGGSSSGTATLPSTASVGSTTYYVSETDGTCASTRVPIVVNINAIPATPSVTDTVSYCQNQVAAQLTPNTAGYNWYTFANGGVSGAAPTPSTAIVGITTYYVSQTISSCESLRDSVKVVVNTSYTAPVASNVNICNGATASALTPNGAGYNWYTAALGGTANATITPSTITTGTVSYFVSQGSGSCESPRAQVDVITLALPSLPNVASPVNYCINATASPISATASGVGNTILYWGTLSTGGTSSTTAPTPITTAVGQTIYYASENDGTCESVRTTITVNVNALPAPPLVSDTVSYCQNQAASQLTPNGAGINWYTAPTGGSSIVAPTPNTSVVGITTYYISQTVSSCESERDSIKVVVNTSFTSPAASNVNNCIGSIANILSPNGTGYNWYTSASGGTASATITPSTATTGTVSYFVSQGSGTCESPRTQVDVITLALPSAPNIISPVNYCLNGTATALNAIASGAGNTLLYWGTNATGGTSSTTATIPITTATGTSTYYVSENDGTCESTRSSIVVNVNAIPATPSTNDTISYCLNETATALNPSGANYNWYTNATGGTATTVLTPSTAANGVTTYYVSETQNGCESLRDSVKVVVNSLFTAPTVSNVAYCFGSTANTLTPNGTGYNWYTASTGGTAIATINPTTNLVGTISYFVSQGSGSCESSRAQVDVVTHALPAKPTGTDVTYCLNEPVTVLTTAGTGTLNWYTVSTGGISSLTAPTPLTNIVGNTDYYVSQTDVNTCESIRDTITVSVINLQSAPTTANIVYCEDATAPQLTATATSQLNWWGTASVGGTSSTTAPTPSTANSGTTTYYVSQGAGACESPRASILVTVNSKPTISFTQNVTTICENACVTFNATSSVTCTNLVWNFGDGNASSNTTANNCYANAGTYDVKVVCTNAQGCSDSSTINNAVIVTPSPQAQISVSPGTTITPSTAINFIADTGLVQPTIVWDFDDLGSGLLNASTIYNPTHVYENIGTYCVNLIVGAGLCKDTATTCIEVMSEPSIEIPNVFTPNNDNINDLFMIKSSGITAMEANIYDRWGILIYTWNGATGSWDGKNKSGNMSSNGVYYYIIKATDFKNLTTDYKGHLQLIDSK